MSKKRVAVLGLDGASLKLIKKWAKEGHLPTLSRLMQGGATGHLRSVIPPVTPPAWTSAFTGMNPGRHGVLHFADLDMRKDLRYLSSLDRHADPLWLILNRHGLKSIVCAVPFTYPPDKFDGIMMSWSPSIQKKYSSSDLGGLHSPFHPPSLEKELRDKFGESVSHLHFKELLEGAEDGDNWKKAPKVLEEAVSGFSSVLEYLLTKYDWNFFMFVDPSTDFLGHKAMPHPRAGREGEVHLRSAYTSADKLLGNILKVIDSLEGETTIIIMSDHGMVHNEGSVYLNRYLHRKGFLEYTVTRETLKKTVLTTRKFSRLKGPISDLIDRLPDFLPSALKELLRFEIEYPMMALGQPMALDHQRSVAVAFPYYQVKVLDKEGMDMARIENELKRSLLSLVDKRSGRPFIRDIVRKEKFFSGPFVSKAPELVLIPTDEHWHFSRNMSRGPVYKPFKGKLKGNHSLNGTLIRNGPGVRSGVSLMRSRIIDLAPTVMYALGLPYPDDMDGKVVTGAYDESYLASHPVTTEHISMKQKKPMSPKEAYTPQEKEGIGQMMESLGYI